MLIDILDLSATLKHYYPFHIIDSLQNILFLFHKNLKAVPEKVQTLFVLQGHSK